MINTEDELLLSHCADLLRLCVDNCMLTYSRFLDIRQQSLVYGKFHREAGCRLFFFGGYDEAERSVAVFVPEIFGIDTADALSAYFSENEQDLPIEALSITKDRFSQPLSHRDYLGSLMGLGIKREMIGDIIVSENGCLLVAEKKIAGYIAENMTSAGRATLTVQRVPLEKLSAVEAVFEKMFVTVASMRLDAVVGSVFNLSRAQALEVIGKGAVFVSGIQCEKPDKRIEIGDKLVLRGKGKVIIESMQGLNKKGKIRLNALKYI